MEFQTWQQKPAKRKGKIDRWGLIKIQPFCALADIIKKVKRQLKNWNKIFSDNTYNSLIFSTYNIYVYVLKINK